MHVLLANYEYPDTTSNCGGGGQITRLLNHGLTATGHTTTVHTDDADRHHTTYPIRTHHKLTTTIEDTRPDIVHGHFTLPTSLLLGHATPPSTPLVVSAMGADVHDPTRYQHIRPLLTQANRYVLRHADAVTTPSHDLQQRLEDQTGHTARVVPYGITVDDWQWTSRTLGDRIRIVSVCRLVERKNLEAGATAVSRLRTRGFNAEYRIVGTGPRHDHLQSKYGDADWLTLTGYVEDLQAELNDAHLFLLPSWHEAFGVAVLEALAAGLPTVVSSTGGQAELVDEPVGRTAPPDDPGALADALAAVITDYEPTQQATHGYVAEHYSHQQMVDDYLDVYRGLL